MKCFRFEAQEAGGIYRAIVIYIYIYILIHNIFGILPSLVIIQLLLSLVTVQFISLSLFSLVVIIIFCFTFIISYFDFRFRFYRSPAARGATR